MTVLISSAMHCNIGHVFREEPEVNMLPLLRTTSFAAYDDELSSYQIVLAGRIIEKEADNTEAWAH